MGTNQHEVHQGHSHSHQENCGHKAVKHTDHIGYLHDGHLHCLHNGHVDEHKFEITSENPESCTPSHDCKTHSADHKHGANCGHEAIPHGDHVDYLVGGHLHHVHGNHCDEHGQIQLA